MRQYKTQIPDQKQITCSSLTPSLPEWGSPEAVEEWAAAWDEDGISAEEWEWAAVWAEVWEEKAEDKKGEIKCPILLLDHLNTL